MALTKREANKRKAKSKRDTLPPLIASDDVVFLPNQVPQSLSSCSQSNTPIQKPPLVSESPEKRSKKSNETKQVRHSQPSHISSFNRRAHDS